MNIRQSRILELLEKSEEITIEEMKNKFNVSEMTIRRDISFLEHMGYVTRVQGGVRARKKLFLDSTFSQREKINATEKKIIARKAVELIKPGDNIIIDTGTTTLYLARELVRLEFPFTVATTSLAVAGALFNSHIDVLIFGGFLRREIPDLIGPLTEKNLLEFHAHKLFMGCDGIIVEEGFFTSDLNISHIEEKMVEIADRVIVLTDSTKFGRKSFVRYANTQSVDTVITDSNVNQKYVEELRNKGLKVIIAPLS